MMTPSMSRPTTPPSTPKADPALLRRRSTKVSWLLRHGAIESGLTMSSAGFAAVTDVLRVLRLGRLELDEIVADNTKARFEVRPTANGDIIRAVQGHSLEGTPVTLDGLEGSWRERTDTEPLFHGTAVLAARAILDRHSDSAGVHAAARSHVHLAPARDAVVGKRHQVDVLLVVDPVRLRQLGQRVFEAPNGVLLTRCVPHAAVVDVVAGSKAGHEALSSLRQALAPLHIP